MHAVSVYGSEMIGLWLITSATRLHGGEGTPSVEGQVRPGSKLVGPGHYCLTGRDSQAVGLMKISLQA